MLVRFLKNSLGHLRPYLGSLKRYVLSQRPVRRCLWTLYRIVRPLPASPLVHRSDSARAAGQRVLFIEDRIPHSALGTGYPRSNRMLHEMVRQGCQVTLFPTILPYEEWDDVYQDIPRAVQVALGYGRFWLREFLSEHRGQFDIILVSRPHNMLHVKALLPIPELAMTQARLICDAESLFCLREIAAVRLQGQEVSPQEVEQRIEQEVELARGCDDVICVSEQEAEYFRERSFARVHVLSHAIEVSSTPCNFSERRDILFVGALTDASPNADSLVWFVDEILPRIQSHCGNQIKLLVAGAHQGSQVANLAGEAVHILGRLEDLSGLYNTARLFIAPTRFASGIPLKVIEAAAHGLPVVATELIATQLGWRREQELLTASEPEAFAHQCNRLYEDAVLWSQLRSNALRRVETEYSPHAFAAKLQQILNCKS